MEYYTSKRPPMQEIQDLRKQIQVLEWDSATGEIPTYYAFSEIDRMENRISELRIIIANAILDTNMDIKEA